MGTREAVRRAPPRGLVRLNDTAAVSRRAHACRFLRRPDLLGDVVAGISAGDDERLAQGKVPRAAVSLVPRFLQQFADQFLQLVELLSVQS